MNIDKSLEIMHKTIMRFEKKIKTKEIKFFNDLKNFLPLYEEYNKVTKNLWSMQTVKQFLSI